MSHPGFTAWHPTGCLNQKWPWLPQNPTTKEGRSSGSSRADTWGQGRQPCGDTRVPLQGLRILSPAVRGENSAWEGGRWKTRKRGASRHGQGPHTASAPGAALSICLSAHTRPTLQVTTLGAGQVRDTGQHSSAPLPSSTRGCPQEGTQPPSAKQPCRELHGTLGVAQGHGGQGRRKPVQAAVQAAAQAALPSLPRQACATPPWESPASTAPAVIATGTSTASALLAAASAKPLGPLGSPFPVDGAWHPRGLFGMCCNLVDFGDHHKLLAQAEGASPHRICTFTAQRDSPEITSPPAWP